jgi:hypothetical protein
LMMLLTPIRSSGLRNVPVVCPVVGLKTYR